VWHTDLTYPSSRDDQTRSFLRRRSVFSKTRLSTLTRIALLKVSREWYGPLVLCTAVVVKGRLLPVLQVRSFVLFYAYH
jgi:hypothetical protein